jgi:hypothetical protein
MNGDRGVRAEDCIQQREPYTQKLSCVDLDKDLVYISHQADIKSILGLSDKQHPYPGFDLLHAYP